MSRRILRRTAVLVALAVAWSAWGEKRSAAGGPAAQSALPKERTEK